MHRRNSIFILSETFLCNNISDSLKIKELTPKLHNFSHKARKNKLGVGFGMMFIKNSLTKVQIMNTDNLNPFEYIDTKVTSFIKNIRIITINRPLNVSKSKFIEELRFNWSSWNLEDTRNFASAVILTSTLIIKIIDM